MMLALEKGGADVIELGIPFSDPVADGPAIQESNTVCLRYNIYTPNGTHLQPGCAHP